MLFLLLTLLSSSDAVTLTGSSDYALPGSDFTLTCDVADEGNSVVFYRRPDVSVQGSIQVAGSQCYNTFTATAAPCSQDVCSCTTTSTNYGTVFRWVIQPQTGDQGSVWFCRRSNPSLPEADRVVDSPDYTLNVAYGPGTVNLSPADTTYTRTEGDTLPDITCTADCRPGCTFVWTKPDNTNFTASAVLSLAQLDRSEHGTYRCTARNVVGESTTAVVVGVMYGPSAVGLSPSTTSYTITEGQTLPTVTCSSDCNPVCTYSWTKDGQSHTTGSDLQLTNIQRGQTGVYSCTASNGYGSQTSSDVTVTVNYGPDSSIYFQPKQDVLDRVENQTVPDIVCSADCEPSCTYIWSRTGTTYPNPLSLSTAMRGNAGQYTCTASNSVNQGTKTWNLIVRFPPRIVSLSYTQGDADVPENGSKSLICAVESYPPSTIKWYYKTNNTVLLTTPDVQSSTYTLTSADCLDTGVYTCSVRNSVSNTAVTGDIQINVLCQPRQDHRVMHNHSFGLATSETLTIPANFIANPKPTFNWTFQTSSRTNATLLVNGTDNFGIHNTFEKLSAVSVGTRSNIKEAWFGVYNVTATNSQGSGTVSFSAVAKGKPDSPKDGKVSCPYQDRAILSWRPAFNGGSTQTFTVGIKIHQQDSFVVDKPLNGLYDPGPLQIVNVTVSSLAFDTQHFFTVYAVNDFGNSSLEEEINCTTKAETAPESSPLGSVIGGVVGTLAAVIVVIVIIIIVKRRKSIRKSGEKGKDDNTEMITNRSPEDVSTDGMKPNILYESSDGLKANVLYESSGPLPGCSSEYAIVQKPSKTKPVSPNALYAEVDKKGKPDVYAEVVKPKKKAEKGKQKGKKTKKQADDAYKKVNAVAGTEDSVYANCKDDSKPDSNTGSANRKNHGGLVYLDIEFQEDQESGRKCVIHGIENRTDYADIAFTNHVDPSHQTNENESQPKVDEKSN